MPEAGTRGGDDDHHGDGDARSGSGGKSQDPSAVDVPGGPDDGAAGEYGGDAGDGAEADDARGPGADDRSGGGGAAGGSVADDGGDGRAGGGADRGGAGGTGADDGGVDAGGQGVPGQSPPGGEPPVAAERVQPRRQAPIATLRAGVRGPGPALREARRSRSGAGSRVVVRRAGAATALPAPAGASSAIAQTAILPALAPRRGPRDVARPGDRTHVVQPGESLWTIARDLLGDRSDVARIARRARVLWRLNRYRIIGREPGLLRIGALLRLR